MITKTCVDCKTPKLEGDFSIGQWLKSACRCKCCVRQRNTSYYSQNKERLNADSRSDYQDKKEHYQQLNRLRWQERKEQYASARTAWAESHRDEILDFFHEKGIQSSAGSVSWFAQIATECILSMDLEKSTRKM